MSNIPVERTPQAFDAIYVRNTDGTYSAITSSPASVGWDDIDDKPQVIASGETQEDARTAIGAGTSNLEIGTTSTTAKAGDAVQTATETPATAIGAGTATDVQGILAELEARITALENV